MALDLFIRIFKVDRVDIGAAWNTGVIQDPYWRLYRNESDGASLLHGGRRVRLRPGRVYLVPRDVGFACRNTRTVGHFFVHFDVHGLPRRMQEEFFLAPIELPADAPVTARIRALAESMPWSEDDAFAQRARVQAGILDAIASHIEAVPRARLLAASRRDEATLPMQPALDEIAHHLDGRLTNADLAARCHMSEDHFIRRFRQTMGLTPNRYITEQRLAVAAQLLRFTELSIEQIAERAGFGNRAYLSRIFTRMMDVSPARYRRSSRV